MNLPSHPKFRILKGPSAEEVFAAIRVPDQLLKFTLDDYGKPLEFVATLSALEWTRCISGPEHLFLSVTVKSFDGYDRGEVFPGCATCFGNRPQDIFEKESKVSLEYVAGTGELTTPFEVY